MPILGVGQRGEKKYLMTYVEFFLAIVGVLLKIKHSFSEREGKCPFCQFEVS